MAGCFSKKLNKKKERLIEFREENKTLEMFSVFHGYVSPLIFTIQCAYVCVCVCVCVCARPCICIILCV